MPNPTVKPCGPADAKSIKAVRLRMLQAAPDAYDAPLASAANQPLEHWATWATGADGHRATWLAWHAGEPVAMVAATLRADQCAIGALWVDVAWRHLGVASVLMESAEAWAAARRAAWCALSVAEHNEPAKRLYRARHYVATGVRKRTRLGHVEVYMHKPTGR